MKKMKEKCKEIFAVIMEWVKQHPSILVYLAIAAGGIYLQWVIIALCLSPVEVFSIDAISQVMSTSAEVIAGLYGLTLTGYIFFLDRLQQKAEDDEMLEDIITLLKKRYHNMVLILSGTCFVAIASAFSFMIYNRESHLIPVDICEFWAYETLLVVFITLILNIYFVITVVDPDKIPRASLQYKKKLSTSDKELGSLQEFLQDYEDIEQLLMEKSKGLAVSQIGTNPWKALKHLNRKEMMEIRKLLSDPLLKKLTMVGQYYSYMVFSQEMTVTKEMCAMAKEVKAELSKL